MFSIASSLSGASVTEQALEECLQTLADRGIEAPSYLMVQCSASHGLGILGERLRARWPGTRLHVATSCLGSLTEERCAIGEGTALAMWAIVDPAGDYGAAAGPLDGDPAAAAARVVRAALADAARLGESPALVWISSVPGVEEDVIAGIQRVVGESVPIVGGSAADDEIAGAWRVMSDGAPLSDGLVVSVMFPSVRIGAAFHSGYVPTASRGRITRADGRQLAEIDGEPAGAVYARWTGNAVPLPAAGTRNVLSESALWPLGRRLQNIGGADVHLLSHPETMSSDGGMTLFTRVEVGEELVLMQGSVDALVQRPLQVVRSACRIGELAETSLRGILLVFCAGCMLSARDRMEEVRASVASAFPGVALITAFTFGEQGPVLACQNRHGNLMISAVVFTDTPL